MTNWTKVTKENRAGRRSRETPAVFRARTGAQAAKLIVPIDLAAGTRANIYSDGNGKLAFCIGEKGTFTVAPPKTRVASQSIYIPKKWADRIPFGTTDVHLEPDGDMLVLDLNKLAAPQVAA